jgi:hypothetical protein
LEAESDPLLNLDYLCAAMIVKIKKDLLESDFSMCMAYLLNYQEVADPNSLLFEASAIKRKLKEPPQIKTPNDYFDNLNRIKNGYVPINILCVSGGTEDPLL